jgi:hypothetical protein
VSRYLDSNRLRSVLVAEKRLADDILPAVLKATLEFSTTQTSQLVLQVVDPDLALVAGGFMPKGTAVTYGKLALEVAVREIVVVGSSTPAVQVTCRSRGVQRLRRAKGAHVWRNQSWTQWAGDQAKIVGLGFLGQPSGRKSQITRKSEQGSTPESSWDTLQNGANELGFSAFEAQGVLYFGQPTWLAAHLPQLSVRWSRAGATSATTAGLLQVPTVRDSDDDEAAGYTGSLSVTPDLSELLAPPAAVRVYGIGPYSARYLVTDVNLDLDGVTAGSVTIATPVNPDPQPDSSDTSTKSAKTAASSTGSSSPLKPYVPTPVTTSPDVPPTPPARTWRPS